MTDRPPSTTPKQGRYRALRDDQLFEFEADKALALISEYSGKLREICQNKLNNVAKNRQGNLLFSLMISALSLSAMWFVISGNLVVQDRSAAVLIIGFCALAFLLGWIFSDAIILPKNREAYDASQIAMVLERLISVASHTYEHSQLRTSDRFEFELRLAEAEATLGMYNDLFEYRLGTLPLFLKRVVRSFT